MTKWTIHFSLLTLLALFAVTIGSTPSMAADRSVVPRRVTYEFVDYKAPTRGVTKTNDQTERYHRKNLPKDKKKFPCPKVGCKSGFARRGDFVAHLINKHTEEGEIDGDHIIIFGHRIPYSGLRYKCAYCDHCGSRNSDMGIHERQNHSEVISTDHLYQGMANTADTTMPVESTFVNLKPVTQMVETGAVEKGPASPTRQYKNKILPKHEKPFPCPEVNCESGFLRLSDLCAHLNLRHWDVKEICDNGVEILGYLFQDEKLVFKCPGCDFRSCRDTVALAHLRQYHDANTYNCNHFDDFLRGLKENGSILNKGGIGYQDAAQTIMDESGIAPEGNGMLNNADTTMPVESGANVLERTSVAPALPAMSASNKKKGEGK